MQCPVCGAPAKDITAPGFDGRSVRCSKCGDYDIADGYDAKLVKLDLEDRLGVLRKARRFATGGARPCISGTSF
jgi:hypothetical protein